MRGFPEEEAGSQFLGHPVRSLPKAKCWSQLSGGESRTAPLEGCDSSGAVLELPSASSQIDHIFTLGHLPPPASQRATQSYWESVLAASGIHFENDIRTKDT